MSDDPVIGVAGCGAMGLPMARQLHEAGHEVWGLDVRPVDEFGDFSPRMIVNAREFAAKTNIVISVVRDCHQSMDLLFDDQAIMSGFNPPKTVVICSTLSPRVLPKIAERLPAETTFVDAPMSGAPSRADDGTLTFMVGGDKDVVAALMGLFKIMGDEVHHLGATGTGMTCKVINNFVAVTGVAAVRKALGAADTLGLERERLLDVMRTSSGSTWYGDNLDRISWSREGYDPTNTIGILEKDMLSFLDAVAGREEVAVNELADSVLNALRTMEPLK